MTRFIVFENLKHFGNTVTRLYPMQKMSYFQYDKLNKVFRIQYTDGSWHTINNEGADVIRNEKMFEHLIGSIKDKIVFK